MKDAGYFFDGYGIVEGDTIQLAGQTATARIVSINSNTLVVDKALTWSAGQGVSLAYQGSTPDIGAYEYAGSGATTYTLTINATNGTVAKTPNKTSYTSGETVTLQATPNTGYTFSGWSGDLTGTANPATLIMNANKSVTANFTAASATYTLTISATNGTVTRTPNKTSYTSGETVTLQATPNAGYTFSGWSGDLTGTANPATLIMNANKSVTANFIAGGSGNNKTVGNTTVCSLINNDAVASCDAVHDGGGRAGAEPQHLSSRRQRPDASGCVRRQRGHAGHASGRDECHDRQQYGGLADRAAAKSGVSDLRARRSGWHGCSRTARVFATAAGTPGRAQSTGTWSGGHAQHFGTATLKDYIYSVYANYTPASGTTNYTLTVSATNGTVAKTPNKTSYTSGETVTLQATPNAGYTFSGWSGDLIGTSNPGTLTMNANKSVTANFTAVTYTLAVNASNGTVTKTPSKTSYTSGETVTLQATPSAGYTFTGWLGDLTGTTNPATLTMNANKAVTANFTAVTYTLAVSASNGIVAKTPSKTSYTSGETVTLQATPSAGYTFSGWLGDLTGRGRSWSVCGRPR